jgi:ethanolamine utilization microcompartment shell protein EutS
MLSATPKSPFQSKTVWGGVGAVAVGLVNVLAYLTSPENAAQIGELITGFVATISGAIAIYGRIKAVAKVAVG